MKTLITGASGFIGKSLIKQPLSGQIHTVCRKQSSKKSNGVIEHFGDLQDTNFLKYLAKQKFERVIHLAWSNLPELTPENNNVNLITSKNLIKIMADSGVSEINISGSCLEYGDLETCVPEDLTGTNIGHFGECKLKLLQSLQELGISYRWLRIFYAYGPNQHPNSLLSAAYDSALKQVSFHPKDPTLARDFIFVGDVASAFVQLMNQKKATGVFNVGSGKSTGIQDMLSYLHSQLDAPKIELKLSRPSLHADLRIIEAACGWKPELDHLEGINRFIDWRRNK